ncbi:unnamed protein product [Gongylonema pulchrum]|uniref:PIG-H domain-containing protein n=1 Tax=Gongylonema pulchrum TaxID=637853 RepID=A0A183EKP5_9BILA|nr:unnamed protein product [Gongylonema pulchrum]
MSLAVTLCLIGLIALLLWRKCIIAPAALMRAAIYFFDSDETFRCLGWLISLLVARFCHCRSVRLGKCGFFYVQQIKLSLLSGIVIEIDDLRLTSSFFSTQYSKPIVITVSDIRIEGECSQHATSYRQQYQRSDVERCLYWLQVIPFYPRKKSECPLVALLMEMARSFPLLWCLNCLNTSRGSVDFSCWALLR